MSLRPLTLFGIVVSMVTGIALGISGYHAWLAPASESPEAEAINAVLEQVRDSYVDEVEEHHLVSGALKGMLGNLDPHSSYLEGIEFDDLQAETNGEFGGIGVELGLVDGYFTVVSPIDDTPASRAGLKPGDRMLELEQEPLRGQRLTEVVDRLRGEPGTNVQLTISREGLVEPMDIELTRAVIEIASVNSRLLEPGYGYVRISQFQNDTGDDFARAIKALVTENNGALDGLVLDLRNNPGGVLQASVAVADTLLEDGLIVYTAGRLPSSHLKYRASGRDVLSGAPVAVLINDGSASAAEIVAGALKDHNRATLLGVTSYGKGSVQSVMPLDDDRAIKLTTAYYYTPNGESIHNRGIEPDIHVESAAVDADALIMDRALEVLRTGEVVDTGLQARL